METGCGGSFSFGDPARCSGKKLEGHKWTKTIIGEKDGDPWFGDFELPSRNFGGRFIGNEGKEKVGEKKTCF